MRSLIIVLGLLFVFTQGLIFYHNSDYVKHEYDRVCHAIYDEKVWIDKCYVPYFTEGTTLETFRNIEAVGVIISTIYLLYRSGFSIKKLRKI